MGEVREDRTRTHQLTCSVREAESAPKHAETAAELLIRDLVKKQTKTSTSLEEQLSLRKDFVPAGDPNTSQGGNTLDELRRKTGLSRHELECTLAEKPNSVISKLYKFALSNQCGSLPRDLISQLPDHPLNHLKTLEDDLMRNLGRKRGSEERKRKKRKRRKKNKVEQTCDERPS